MQCSSCQLVRINGVVCHELGCPDAWEGQSRECAECGQAFMPEFKGQKCCDASCDAAYRGFTLDEDDDTDDTLDLSPEAQSTWERESKAYVAGLGDLTAKPAVPFGWDKV